MQIGEGTGSRRDHTNKHGRPGPADGLRRCGCGGLEDGPPQLITGDGLVHARLREFRPHRLPERRQIDEGHGAKVQGPEHKAPGRSVRHEHDLERASSVSCVASMAYEPSRGSHEHLPARRRGGAGETRHARAAPSAVRRPTTSSRRASSRSRSNLAS